MGLLAIQLAYDNQLPDEAELTQQEVLEGLTFKKKVVLAIDDIDLSDDKLAIALITDIRHSFADSQTALHQILDLIGNGKTKETELYINDLLIETGKV